MGEEMWVQATATVPEDDNLPFPLPTLLGDDGFDVYDWWEEVTKGDSFIQEIYKSYFDLVELLVGVAADSGNTSDGGEIHWDSDTREITVTGSYNYGLTGFEDSVGDITVVEEFGGSWEMSDDGGKYYDGSYRASGIPFTWCADSDGEPILTRAYIKQLADRPDAEIVAILRAFPEWPKGVKW